MSKPRGISATIIKASEPVQKAETSTEIQSSATSDGAGFISPPTDLRGYKRLVNNSSILPQCIRAYKNNIAGFGIGVRYKEDLEETPEMKAEWDKISEVLEFLNMDQDTKEIFEDIIEARETYGIAYLEVIRNLGGEVIGIEFINNIPSVQKTAALTPYVDIEYEVNGKTATRQKKFCKYRQQLNGKTVFFKEIGDPRVMDNRTGEYGEGIPVEYQANELLEFAIGTEPYGEVRWIGTVLNVDGSRKAESLNNRYFSEGRHTPLMILINGGTLTDDSFDKLTTYMNDIKGENGQHAFIVLEAENLDNRTDMEASKSRIWKSSRWRIFCKKTSFSRTTSTTTAARCNPRSSFLTFTSAIRRTSTALLRNQRRRLRKSRYFSRSGKASPGLSIISCLQGITSNM